MSNWLETIQKAAGTFNKDFVEIIACVVDSVDKNEFTCDCTAISGVSDTKIPGVKLSAEPNDGIIVYPAVGSTVMVISSTRNSYYVYMTSDVDGVACVIDATNSFTFDSSGFVWNDGLKGGLINITAQTLKLNALVAQLQAQLTLIAAGIVAGGGSYTPGVLTPFNQLDFEDLKVKH